MPKNWQRELADELAKYANGQKLPSFVNAQLAKYPLASTNQHGLTLVILRKMANAALEMMFLLMPGIRTNITAWLCENSIESHAQVMRAIATSYPGRQYPTIQARNYLLSLLAATRYRRSGPGREPTVAELRTATAVALWTAIYYEFREVRGKDEADRTMTGMFKPD